MSGGCTDASFAVLATTGAGATSYSATTLNPLTQYFFKVRAVDEGGNISASSAEATGTTDPAVVANSPTFSPTAGTYGSVQNVTISTTSTGASICYTTNGTSPTCIGSGCDNGTNYTSPLNVVNSQTIAAMACAGGYTPSVVSSVRYTLNTICLPFTCSQLGSSCGNSSDGCGAIINCGNCAAPQTCDGISGVCGLHTICAPMTCAQLGSNCGTISNGCGGMMNCGACTTPQTCRGVPSLCQ